MKTSKPQEGIWTLIAPDGRVYRANTPIKCVVAEQRERIPTSIAVKRVLNAVGLGNNDKE